LVIIDLIATPTIYIPIGLTGETLMNCFVRGGRALFVLGAAALPIVVESWVSLARAGDWPTFRGPGRTAVSSDAGLLQAWPAEGPKLVWETQGGGRGYSSLAIAGHQIYTLGDGPSTAEDKDEYLLCFNRDSGAPLWKAKTGPAWNSGQSNWQGSRSTPTVDGDRVYVISPHGELVCCDTSSGQERWRKSLKNDFQGKKGDNWGYSESPLVDGDLLVCTPGGETTTMVALNKLTGEVVWKVARKEDRGAGHSSIVVSNISGTKIYVQLTANGPLGVRASDGQILWTFPMNKVTAVIPTPIVRDNLVFYAVGYGTGGGTLIRQIAGQNGAVTIEQVNPLNSALVNKHGGTVLVGDYVYGDTDDGGIPHCAELMTGKKMWQKRGSGKGSTSIISADGCLYLHYADGTMALAKADPTDYVETGSFKVPGSGERPSWSHPVIVDGRLYLREQDKLLCYDLRAN
jgi:outer membrane protein assembly factor BamB